MNVETYKILFFSIHLMNLVALILHIGIKEDGFDVKMKRLSKTGKVATVLESLSIIAFIGFVYHYHSLCDLSSLYLGFSITVAIFSIPFLTTCHIKYSKQKVKLNFAGFVALLVGLSGFLCSFIWFFDSNEGNVVQTDMIDNYISILGQFIAGTSALIAFSGTTIESKQEKNDKGKPIPVTRLTDLGKVAITVIIIGFAVSIINFNLENAEKERVNIEVDQILAQAHTISQNLDTANNFLTHELMPKTEQWLMSVNNKVNEIEDIDQKIIEVQKELSSVVKSDELQPLAQKLSSYKTEITKLKQRLKNTAKARQIEQLNKEVIALKTKLKTTAQSIEIKRLKTSIESYKAEVKELKNKLNQVAQKQDIDQLRKDINKLYQAAIDTTRH